MTGEELRNLLKNKGVNFAELAEKMGLTPQGLNSKFRAASVKQQTIVSIESIVGGLNKENSTVIPYETYLLPLSAMGGPLSGFAANGVTLANCEKIVSPIEDVDFAITIYGESMYPKYPSGARLLIKKINPDVFIDWGKSYVLDTSNGVIVKEVHMSDKEGCITCYSMNPDPKFKPFDVPLSEVYGMYRVLMSLSAE